VSDYPGAASVIPSLPWLIAALAAAAALSHDDVVRIAAVCAGASALLLAAIDRAEPCIGWQAARVLSDLALMSPLVPLLCL
jgi:hypothetical protein